MAKTSRDAYKHIQALSEFFSDANEVGTAVVESFINDHKKKKYLKQSLDRLINRGFLVADGRNFKLTKAGARFLNPYRNRRPETKKKWDGKWRLVSFDVPGSYSSERDSIRRLLVEFDFYPLHKSVWISPNTASENFWKLLVDEDLDKYCKVMVVEIIEGDRELRKYFKLD